MEKDLRREIEALTGRTVVGFMSDNHIDPDLAVEVFVLAPRTDATCRSSPDSRRASWSLIGRLDARR
jgi:uncharacterized protein YbcI